MKKIKIMMLALVFLFYGCASILNPYKSKFQCPDTDKGKCIPMEEAYKKSKELKPAEKPQEEKLQEEKKKSADKPVDKKAEASDTYQDSLYKRLSGLLDKPVTPVVAPAQVLRVLLLSYQGKGNELFMPRYVYIMIEEPKWILNELPELEGGNKSTTPD